MAYCRSCRIGTIDAEGLCVLCGASQAPPTRVSRVAEASGAVVSALLSPAALVVAVLGFATIVVVAVSRYGAQGPSWGLRPPGIAGVAAGSGGLTVFGLLWPALIQSLILLLVVLVVLLLMRRRRTRDEQPSFGETRRAAWS